MVTGMTQPPYSDCLRRSLPITNVPLLLDPIMRCGDQELAEDIARVCFDGKKLKENMPGDILHVLGYLDYDRMMDYMVASITANDWYLSKAACIGLMHLPCERYAEIFADELERVYGQPLFPEFLPALCFKFTDARMVPRLMEWGSRPLRIAMRD